VKVIGTGELGACDVSRAQHADNKRQRETRGMENAFAEEGFCWLCWYAHTNAALRHTVLVFHWPNRRGLGMQEQTKTLISTDRLLLCFACANEAVCALATPFASSRCLWDIASQTFHKLHMALKRISRVRIPCFLLFVYRTFTDL
jgi:hypothetical protein